MPSQACSDRNLTETPVSKVICFRVLVGQYLSAFLRPFSSKRVIITLCLIVSLVFIIRSKFTYKADILLHDKLPESIKHIFPRSLYGNDITVQSRKFYLKKNQNMNLKGHIETSTQDALMYVEEG